MLIQFRVENHRSLRDEQILSLVASSEKVGTHVLRADELEASLHPVLALNVVRLFNDPVHNPRNAQLVFATHDTNLLGSVIGEPVLRRDQVWFTEKDEGGTHLYPLTNFHPRKEENLDRGYLQGRYGAIPFLGELVRPPADDGARSGDTWSDVPGGRQRAAQRRGLGLLPR